MFTDELFLHASKDANQSSNRLIMNYDSLRDDDLLNSSFAIHAHFQASSPFRIEWSLDGKKLTVTESHTLKLGALRKQNIKYIQTCDHVDVFKYLCVLYVLGNSKRDVGEYQALVQLKGREDISLRLAATSILPSMLIALSFYF